MLSLLNAKFQLQKKKSIIFLNSKKLGQSCILHCHLIMSRFIPKKKHFKSASTWKQHVTALLRLSCCNRAAGELQQNQ